MSLKGWNRGEPFEPTNFQQPELMENALNGLGTRVSITREALCTELYFKPETFTEITGLSISPNKRTKAEVLSFRHR
jgi:hypothetical protein